METIILDSNGYPRLDRFNFVKNELEISLGELREKYEDDFQQQIINKSKRPVRKEISTVQVKTMLYKACIGIGMKITRNYLESLVGKNSFKGHELLLVADVLGITTVEELKKFYIH